MEELSVGDTRGRAQALVDSLADTVAEVQTVAPGDILRDAHAMNDLLCDRLGNAEALIDTLANTVLKMEELSVGDIRGGAQALVDALADTHADVEALTSCHTLRDSQALNVLLGDTWRHIGQCAGTARHAE